MLTAPVESTNAVTSIRSIGDHMLSTGEGGYLLPFEAVSILLLACIVGALIIARKRKTPQNHKQTMIHLEYMLIISAVMMFAGVFGFLTRKSTLAILLSVELMLNATDLNFAVFNRMLYPDGYEGYFFALFSIAISAAESAIAIAIMINIYRMLKNIQVDELEKMKW